MGVFQSGFEIAPVLLETGRLGYAFRDGILEGAVLDALLRETSYLNLEVGDHVSKPLWPGSKREVRQLHARSYFQIGKDQGPIATAISILLASEVADCRFPDLTGWIPTEAGYQHYRGESDFISAHRDRRNDQLLSFTVTISGSAVVRILEPIEDPDDYTNVRILDEHRTVPGTVMFLRAPGFCGGEQVVHEVLPPTTPGGRLILNLRMRPDVLSQP